MPALRQVQLRLDAAILHRAMQRRIASCQSRQHGHSQATILSSVLDDQAGATIASCPHVRFAPFYKQVWTGNRHIVGLPFHALALGCEAASPDWPQNESDEDRAACFRTKCLPNKPLVEDRKSTVH